MSQKYTETSEIYSESSEPERSGRFPVTRSRIPKYRIVLCPIPESEPELEEPSPLDVEAGELDDTRIFEVNEPREITYQGIEPSEQPRTRSVAQRVRRFFERRAERKEFKPDKPSFPSRVRQWYHERTRTVTSFPSKWRYFPDNLQELLSILYVIDSEKSRWENEDPTSLPTERLVDEYYKRYIELRDKVGDLLISNIAKLHLISEQLELCEEMMKEIEEQGGKVYRNRVLLFDDTKNIWKEMNVSVSEMVYMYQDEVRNFLDIEYETNNLVTASQLNAFISGLKNLKEFAAEDRKTLSVIEENMISFFKNRPKPRLSVPRFKVKKMFPLRLRDQRGARRRIQEFRQDIEEQVIPEGLDETGVPFDEYSVRYERIPCRVQRQQSRNIF